MSTARFTRGSPMGHIVVMTAASTASLLAIFLVDLADMFFLSLLGEVELAAAIGYAGSILFFSTSVCIGLSIASGALAARALGAEDRELARRYVVNAYAGSVMITLPVSLVLWLSIPALLELLGAQGRAAALATSYLRIIVPSMPILAWAMASNGVLRATGDARRSMVAMISGGVVNAILDPLFIFVLELGVDGAALASVCSRVTILLISLRAVTRVHRLSARFRWSAFGPDLPALLRIAMPAVLTNITTPIANAYVIAAMAAFGDGAVAGSAIIGRLTPVAFAAIFALSGAIGPIIGQNYGAKQPERVRRTLLDALLLVAGYVLVVTAILYFTQDVLIQAFDASPEAAALMQLFCSGLALGFIFNGALFISNAAFNNLDRAHYATLLNFTRATLGTIPFVHIGAHYLQAPGVLIGQMLGSLLVGLVGMLVTLGMVQKLIRDQPTTLQERH